MPNGRPLRSELQQVTRIAQLEQIRERHLRESQEEAEVAVDALEEV
jgi:hypothetical protein